MSPCRHKYVRTVEHVYRIGWAITTSGGHLECIENHLVLHYYNKVTVHIQPDHQPWQRCTRSSPAVTAMSDAPALGLVKHEHLLTMFEDLPGDVGGQISTFSAHDAKGHALD